MSLILLCSHNICLLFHTSSKLEIFLFLKQIQQISLSPTSMWRALWAWHFFGQQDSICKSCCHKCKLSSMLMRAGLVPEEVAQLFGAARCWPSRSRVTISMPLPTCVFWQSDCMEPIWNTLGHQSCLKRALPVTNRWRVHTVPMKCFWRNKSFRHNAVFIAPESLLACFESTTIRSTSVNNKLNYSLTFSGFSFPILVLCMLADCHELLGPLNRTEQLFMLLVTLVLFLFMISYWQFRV